MSEQLEKIETTAKKTWTVVIAWVGGISALIGFVASVGGGVTWIRNHRRDKAEYQEKMALAQTQAGQQQYQAALGTYSEILKDHPLDQAALDDELDTAMRWVENFSVITPEGKDEASLSGAALDELLSVLTAGLARTKDVRMADVEAHLGWAHFLNAKIAQREDDSVAVNDWHTALSRDPTNVYANAMLGNWMLQSDGDYKEAVEHFHAALQSGRARPFARRLEVGALLGLDVPGARVELMRTANEMRRDGEDLDLGERHRIAGWCFNAMFMNQQQLVEVLTAVSSEDAWSTFSWLDAGSGSNGSKDFMRELVHANLLELAGQRGPALNQYLALELELRDRPGSLHDQVEASIARLNHP